MPATTTTLVTLDHALITRAVTCALSSLSANTRRAYSARITAYLSRERELSRESVKRYLRSLEHSGASPPVINQSLAALKRLASEAAELGWLPHTDASQIVSIRMRRVRGSRTGHWLTHAQASALLQSCDRSTLRGKRDACVLALLLGCGLRRSELVNLDIAQVRTMELRIDGELHYRMVLENVIGKGRRVRTITVPEWARLIVQDWVMEREREKI